MKPQVQAKVHMEVRHSRTTVPNIGDRLPRRHMRIALVQTKAEKSKIKYFFEHKLSWVCLRVRRSVFAYRWEQIPCRRRKRSERYFEKSVQEGFD